MTLGLILVDFLLVLGLGTIGMLLVVYFTQRRD